VALLWRSIWITEGGSLDTEISLFHYGYTLLEPTSVFNSLQIASISDLACMKLEAIGSRGLKRDFFDLYTICQLENWSLRKVLDFTIQKYQRQTTDVPHLLKSLVYFDDAETRPERAKIVDSVWEDVKKFFITETNLILSGLIQRR